MTSVKEGDAVVLSTLAHCGRCPACEVGRPTECRNAPNPKDAKPFTVRGAPAYQFANASAFAEQTVVREQSAIPIDPRVPFDRAALIGCGIMTGVGAVLNRARVETGATMAVFGLGGIGLTCVQGGVLAGRGEDHRGRRRTRRSSSSRGASAPRTWSTPRATIPSPRSRDLTRGGADYTFEGVGNVAVIQQALDALGAGRHAHDRRRAEASARASSSSCTALYQNKAILGCRYGAARPRRDFPMLADLYLGGPAARSTS